MRLYFIVSNRTEPYWNIAVEHFLVNGFNPSAFGKEAGEDFIVLYLWRNHRTVVIGQNQNPYAEVNLEALQRDGGYLMRRRTGGGAVYHDEGNVNFSFVAPHDLYDQQRQFAVVRRAVEAFGLHTELSGRNDILAEGRKFSGNAFSKGRLRDLHHGTLLISGHLDDLQQYLLPKPAKLMRHGVASVRSRVVNLSELNPAITPDSLSEKLRDAFAAEYGNDVQSLSFDEIVSQTEVIQQHDIYASEEWLYGSWRYFRATKSAQFDWGGVDIQVIADEERGIITDVQIASDALDLEVLEQARKTLIGASLAERPEASNPIIEDIIALVYA
jgi:lipoate-protein ligase A